MSKNGLDKGIKDFKTENPKRQITDDQMTKVRSDKKNVFQRFKRKKNDR